MTRMFGLFWRLFKLGIRVGLIALVGVLLWVWFADAYEDVPHAACGAARPPVGIEELEQEAPGYVRPESSTYLAVPRWYTVYNSEEYARTLASDRPSRFPYFRSAAQYWRYYYRVFKITQAKYGFMPGDHVMLAVNGVSFTIEHTLKGAYENTIGRLSERFAGTGSDEDKFAAKVAEDYARLLHSAPFYAFSYGRALTNLWRDVPLRGTGQARKIERRVMLSLEYSIKGVFGGVIHLAMKAMSRDPANRVYALVTDGGAKVALQDARIREVARPSNGARLIAIPRDEPFTEVVPSLAARGVTFFEIAGNDEIFITALAPADWKAPAGWRVVLSEPIVTEPGRIRIGLTVPVSCVRRVIDDLKLRGATLEHLYDY